MGAIKWASVPRDRLANGWLNPARQRHTHVTEHDAAGETTPASEPEPAERDAPEDESTSESESTGRDGRRFVLLLYAALVGVATTAGLLTGTFVDGLEAPRFLFLIPFPATPLGFAAYGGLTLAVVLGVPLALVIYVSQTIDDVD